MKIQYTISFILFIICMAFVGCGFLDPVVKTDSQGNQVLDEHGEPVIVAQGAQYLEAAQDVANTASGIPIYGAVASGIAGILGIAIGFVNQAARKRANALEATVLGVNTFSDNYSALEKSVLDIMKGIQKEDLTEKVQELFAKHATLKDTIQKIANSKGIETFLHWFIQRLEQKTGTA